MDMKKFLQAVDGVSTKTVEGGNDMKKFLHVVSEANLNQPVSEAVGDEANVTDQVNSYIRYSSGLYAKSVNSITIKKGLVLPITFTPVPPSGDSSKVIQANIFAANAKLPKELQLPPDQLSAVVGGADQAYAGPVAEEVGISRLLAIISEGKGPLNRATAAESMTMQHYTASKQKTITSPVLNVAEGATPSMIGKYFKAVEQELKEAAAQPNKRATQLAQRVIERIIPGQEPAPGINRLTGKPNPQVSAPAAPATVQDNGQFSHFSNEYLQKAVDAMNNGVNLRLLISGPDAEAELQRRGALKEDTNPEDKITMDVPLLMRVLEHAREDIKDDMALHNVVDRLIELSANGETLTMDNYDAIVGDQLALPAPDEDKDSEEDY